MKIGARILKTGITLVIAIYISQFLHLEPVIYAAIAATLAIQPSIYRSWKNGIEQIQANLVGATIAMIFSTFIGTHPIVIALAIMLVIGINLQLHFERSIALSIVTVLSIMEGAGHEANFFLFAVDRFLLIFIGLFSAFIVNAFLFPPRYEQRLMLKLKNTKEQVNSTLRIILEPERNERSIRTTLVEMEKELDKLWDLFHFEQEAKSYFKKKLPFSSSRKLVIFKKMLETSQQAIQMFYMIEKYQNTLQRLPNSLLYQLHQQLIDLANYQDKIYSKLKGMLHSAQHHSQDETIFLTQWNIYEQIKNMEQDPEIILDVVTILTVIREYHKQLDHLEKLIDSYHTHHSPI